MANGTMDVEGQILGPGQDSATITEHISEVVYGSTPKWIYAIWAVGFVLVMTLLMWLLCMAWAACGEPLPPVCLPPLPGMRGAPTGSSTAIPSF